MYTITYGYDGAGINARLNSIQQTDGSKVTIEYDSNGWVQYVKDDQLRQTKFEYNLATRTTTVTDHLSQATTLTYSASNQLMEIAGSALGGASFKQSYTYNANGDLLTSKNAAGETTTFAYDGVGGANGAWTRRTDHIGNVVERTFDAANGLQLSETVYSIADADGVGTTYQAGGARTTQYFYDPNNLAKRQLAYVLGPQGEVTRFVYNTLDQLASQVQFTAAFYTAPNPTFAALQAWVDSSAQATSVARQVIEYSYDLRGQVQEERRYTSALLKVFAANATNAGPLRTTYTYDAFGRLLYRKDASGVTLSYEYDGLNRVTKTIDTQNVETIYSYDDAGRKTSVKLDNGETTVQIFDTMGRLVSSDVMGVGNTDTNKKLLGETKYTYDALGRLFQVKDATNVSSYILYDVSGRKSADVAANGQLTEYFYDAAGRLIQSVAYAKLISVTGLSSASTVAGVRPANDGADRITTFYYDGAGRLVATQDADGYFTQNQYDGASALVTQTRFAKLRTPTRITGGTTQSTAPALSLPTSDAEDRSTSNFYDASGQLAARIDGAGALTKWTYDAAGNMLSQLRGSTLLTPAQRTSPTTASLLAITPAADDEFTQWIYDNAGRRLAQIDGEGFLTEYNFDAAGRPTGDIRYLTQAFKPVISGSPVTLKLFKVSDLTPALRTTATGVTAPLKTSKSYNNRGLLEKETAVDGSVTFYTYDNRQRLQTVTYAQSQTEERSKSITYDDWGRVSFTQTVGDAAGVGVTTAYDVAGRRTKVIDARGYVTVFYYDDQGRQVYAIRKNSTNFSDDGEGEVAETFYSNFSEVKATVTHKKRLSFLDTGPLTGGLVTAALTTKVNNLADSSDNRVDYTYNNRGLIQLAIDALGFKSDTRYNAFGQVSTVTSDAGKTPGEATVTRTQTYDQRGLWLTATRSGAGVTAAKTEAKYDALGRLTQTIDELNQSTYSVYDRNAGSGRQLTVTGPAGSVVTTYDALDRVLTRKDRNSNTVTYGYDDVNRTFTVKTAEGIETSTTTNRHGQTVLFKDGAGQSTTYTYDKHGNLETVTDALGNVTKNSYDANDNLTQVVQGLKANGSGNPINDGSATTTVYTFDAVNRVLTQTVDPLVNGSGLNLQTRYEYDGQGRKVKVTDPRGTISTQVFNAKGELTDVIVDDVSGGLRLRTSYSYDAQSRVLTSTEGAGTASARKTAYAYDVLGRRTSETLDPDGLKLKTSYEYDAAGRIVTKRDAQNNVTARYSYDAAGRVRFSVDAFGAVVRYDYDKEGRVKGVWSYGTLLSTGWTSKNDDDLLTALVALGFASTDQSTVNAYDKDGRLLYSIDGLGQVTERKYDGANRVVMERRYAKSVVGVTSSMTLFAVSLKVTAAKNDANDHFTRYAYDKVGNQRYVVNAEGYVSERRYDAAGRIVASVEHEQAWTASVNTVPTEADLAMAYSPVRTEFNTGLEGFSGSAGVWEAGRLKLISEPVQNGGWVSMTSLKTMPVGSIVKLDYQPMQIQQMPHILIKDGAGGLGRVAIIFKKDGHVYTQRRQPLTGTVTESDLGAYTPGKTYCIEMDSTATGAQVFVYEKGTSITSGMSQTVTEPTMNWQSVQLDINVLRASDLPSGQTISYVDNVEELAVAKGRVTQFAYDAAGRQRFALDAEGYVTETRYDDANARTTTLRYPGRLGGGSNYAPSVTAPALSTFTAALSSLGTAISVIRELDRAGRLGLETDGNGVQTQFNYDAVGRLVSEVQASNVAGQSSTTRYVYNAGGQRTAVIRADGTALVTTTRYEYDNLGRLYRQIDARGLALAEGTAAWEQAERVRLGFPADLSTLNADDKAAAQATLRKLYTTEYGYDAGGRVTKTTDAMGGITQTDYDNFGNVSVITDARGYKRYQIYDKTGHLIQSVDPERYVTAYSYDAFGNLTSTTRADAKVQGTVVAGQAVTLASSAPSSGAYVLTNIALDHTTGRVYDRNNRLLKETDAESYVEGTDALDAFGQRLTVKNKLGYTVTYSYDRLGRVLTETLPVQAKDGGNTLRAVVNEYQYDSRGNRIVSIEAKGLQEQRTTQMSYDGANRLMLRVGMTYDAYDSAGNKTTIVPVDRMRYDARGNLIEQISHGQLQTDGLTVIGGKRSVAYYDALNRKALEISADRVAGSFSYDLAGNLMGQTVYATRIADGVTIDPAGAAPALAADAANDRTLSMRYDALNRKTETALGALYSWSSGDGTNLVISGLTAQKTVLQQLFYDAVGNLTERKDGRGNSSFAYFDGNGRRVLSIDAGGAVTAWEYGTGGGVATKETKFATMLVGGYARQADRLSLATGPNDAGQLLGVVASQFVMPGEQNRTTEFSLDRLDRVTKRSILNVTQDAVDASGTRFQSATSIATVQYQYNGLGAITMMRQLAGQVGAAQTWEQTDVQYDGLGREVHREAPGYVDYLNANVRPTTDTEYDGLGNVKRRILRGTDTAIETDDRINLSTYDVNGLLKQTTDASGAVTTYTYDVNGNVSRSVSKDVRRSDLTTKRDVISSYDYDAAGRLTVEKRWESDKPTAVDARKSRYNAFGEISAKGIGDGWEEFAEYSTLGKVSKTNSGDGAIKFYVYDANGNMTREIRGNGDESVDLKAMTLAQATVSTKLYSRVSAYNSRNLLIKTIDPQIEFLKNSVAMGALYQNRWVPAFASPVVSGVRGDYLPAAGITPVNGGNEEHPKLIFSFGGSHLFFKGVFNSLAEAKVADIGPYYGYNVADTSFSNSYVWDVNSLKQQGPKCIKYLISDSPDGDIAGVGYATVSVDAAGQVTVTPISQAEGDVWRTEAYVSIPPNPALLNSTDYSFSLKDRDTGVVQNSNVAYAYNGNGYPQPAMIPMSTSPRWWPNGRTYGPMSLRPLTGVRHLQLEYKERGSLAGSAYVNIDYYPDGTVNVSPPGNNPTAQPVGFTIWGRNVPHARIYLGGQAYVLNGTYTEPEPGMQGHTDFWFDAQVLPQGAATYELDLQLLNGSGNQMTDEVGNPLFQHFRLVMTGGSAAPQAFQEITTLKNQPGVTITRVQSFNAFGDIVEERDERVAERMLAAINDDRASKNLAPLAVLTNEQLAAARTTLQYNALGQLVAKTDPETFITAENGFRYRDRPVTKYGYDLLGRHTTTTDANGKLTRTQYSAGGRDEEGVAATFDAAGGNADAFSSAAGGKTVYGRDIFGDVRKITDAYNNVVMQDYDAMGRLTASIRKDAQRYDLNGTISNVGDLKDTYAYDELGQRIGFTNAADNKKPQGQQVASTTDYDAMGRVVKTVSAGGSKTEYSYSLKQASDGAILAMGGAVSVASGLTSILKSGGYIKTTLQADGRSQIDEIEYFGHTTRHKDLNNAVFTYSYNSAGQLTKKESTERIQSVSYTYYANGYIQSLRDNSLMLSAEYAYDNAGNRVYEGYFKLDPQGGKDADKGAVAYQNGTITYDELNRIVRAQDTRLVTGGTLPAPFYDIHYEFDAVGNRRLVDSVYWDGAAGLRDRQTFWYAYDALNRFTVTKGQLSTTSTNTSDSNRFINARRGSSISDASVKIETGNDGIMIGYDKLSRRATAQYVYNGQTINELYEYSSDGYLQNTRQGGALKTTRVIDELGRTVRQKDLVNNQETQSDYDGDNRLVQQRFFDGQDSGKNYSLDFNYYSAVSGNAVADSAYSATGKGVLARTVLTPTNASSNTTTTTYTYEYWDGAQQSVVTKTQAGAASGKTYFYYDYNGHLTRTYDAVAVIDNLYTTTSTGLILQRGRSSSASNFRYSRHFFYYADDHRIGDVSDTPEDVQRVSYAEQLAMKTSTSKRSYYRQVPGEPVKIDPSIFSSGYPTYYRGDTYRPLHDASTADFDQNYEPINDNYPGAAASSYTVRSDGETLASIAQSLWGDRAMWYLIAESNGLPATAYLKAGQVLVIPNKVTNIHNNSTTWRPYNAGEAIGRSDPTTPTPSPRKDRCGAASSIIGVIVAAVVTVLADNPVAGAAAGDAARQYSAAAFNGRLDYKDLGKNLIGLGFGVPVPTIDALNGRDVFAHPPGFLGENKYDYRSTAIAAVAAYAGEAASEYVGGSSALNGAPEWAHAAARSAAYAATSNATGQALRGDWNWRSVMISAFSAGAGTAIAGGGADFTSRLASGLTAALIARSLSSGNRQSYATVFASTLGSAIGGSLASQSTQGQGPWSSVDYRNGSDIESDAVMAQQAASSPSGSGLRVSLAQRDAWGPQSSFDDVRLPTDYSLDTDGVRLSGGPRSVTAASGDSWARIAKQRYGDERFALALARANGANSSFLAAGQDVVLPDLSGANLKVGGVFIAADAAERARNAFDFSDGRDARDIRLSFAYQSRVSRELSDLAAARGSSLVLGTGQISADPGYFTSLSNVLGSDLPLSDKLSMAWDTSKYYFRNSNGMQGAVQSIGGVLEVGGAGALTSTGLGTALAVPLAFHGGDNIGTGWRRMFADGDGQTVTYSSLYSLTGSRSFASAVDQGIPFLAGAAGAGQLVNGLGLEFRSVVDPNRLRYTQATVGYRSPGSGFTIDETLAYAQAGGELPRVDVVRLGNGDLASIDNRRVFVGRRVAGDYEGYGLRVNVREFDELLTPAEADRFTLRAKDVAMLSKRGFTDFNPVPQTWGDAAWLRILNQETRSAGRGFSTNNPTGSLIDPKITGRP